MLEGSKSKAKDNWFELLGGLRNLRFKKSGFYNISTCKSIRSAELNLCLQIHVPPVGGHGHHTRLFQIAEGLLTDTSCM